MIAAYVAVAGVTVGVVIMIQLGRIAVALEDAAGHLRDIKNSREKR